jgi:hypothetical protein
MMSMARTREIKLENLVRISDPRPDATRRIEYSGNGPVRVEFDQGDDELAAAEKILRGAYDVRGNRNYGPAEAGMRLRERSGPAN